jgi:uncharacterized protein
VIRAILFLPLLVLGGVACDAQSPAGDAQVPPPIVRALSSERSAKPLPPLTGRVVDRAEVLSAEAEASLAARLEALEKETTDQLVVVTVESLEGEKIDDLGLRLGNGWGIGRKGVDNGVLLIVAPNDRRARIDVGYGLEGLLTDERAAEIMKERIIPSFKAGRIERGIEEGVVAIVAALKGDTRRPRPRMRAAA